MLHLTSLPLDLYDSFNLGIYKFLKDGCCYLLTPHSMHYTYLALVNFISTLCFLPLRQDMSRYAAFTAKCFYFWIITLPTVHSLWLLLQYILIPCIIQSFFISPMSHIVSYHIISYHIIYRITSYRVVSCRVVSCRIVSYCIVSFRIIYFPSVNPQRIT